MNNPLVPPSPLLLLTVFSTAVVCGEALAAAWQPLPDTGQDACYEAIYEYEFGEKFIAGYTVGVCPGRDSEIFGQDAHYRNATPAYTDNQDGSITDRNSGLVWQRADDGVRRTRPAAVEYCESLTPAGGWRLPHRRELVSILDYGRSYPAVDTRIFSARSAGYWTADEYTPPFYSTDVSAWEVDFSTGTAFWKKTNQTSYVRCVRDPGESGPPAYEDNGDGTTTDLTTGLVWMRNPPPVDRRYYWDEALHHCNTLDYGGWGDWRLPSVKELESLVDITRSPQSPVVNPAAGISVAGGYYWSSTTLATDPDQAWYIYLGGSGYIKSLAKRDDVNIHLICVRDGLGPNPGDLNGDHLVELADAVIALQLLTGLPTGAAVPAAVEPVPDGVIRADDLLYILQRVAGQR